MKWEVTGGKRSTDCEGGPRLESANRYPTRDNVGRHPGRRWSYIETIDFVARGMDFLCRRTATLQIGATSVHPGTLGQVRCRTRVIPGNNIPTPRPPPLPSTRQIILPALTTFWVNFNLDELDLEEKPDIPLDDLWDEVRLRTAPRGVDDWEPLMPPDSLQDDDGSGHSQTSDVFVPSTPDEQLDFSRAPLPVRLQAGVHLLEPVKHKITRDANVGDVYIGLPPPLRLVIRSSTSE